MCLKQFLQVKLTEMRELDFNFETSVGYTHNIYIPILMYIHVYFIKINIIDRSCSDYIFLETRHGYVVVIVSKVE